MNITSIALRLSLPILVSSAVLASASTATAANAIYTGVVGYKTETIAGNDAVSFISPALLSEAVYDGALSAVGEGTISLANVDLSDLLDPLAHYFVDIVTAGNAEAAGTHTSVLHWEGSTLTLADDLSDLLTAGTDRIRIHRLPTIGEIFGGNGDVVQGGTASNADMIFLPNPNGNDMIALYYSVSPIFGTGWRQIGVPGDKSDTPVYFTDGIYIHKRSAGNANITFTGEVKETRTTVVVPKGFIPYSSVYPSGTTLGNSGLYNAENPQQSLRAGTATTADSIMMDTDGDGIAEVYYYSQSPIFGNGWRQLGAGGDKADVELTSGFVIINSNETTSVTLNPVYQR